MLAKIRGVVADLDNFRAIIDVWGLGFEAQLTRKAAANCSVGKELTIFSYLQFSEAGASLFGFADDLEKAVFLRLTSVKGIGGKMALQILQGISAEEVVQAISLGDYGSLTKAQGIGKKTAERICFELQEKMSLNLPRPVEFSASSSIPDSSTVIDALESLGFSRQEGSEALSSLSRERGSTEGLGVEDLIMLALKRLNHKA